MYNKYGNIFSFEILHEGDFTLEELCKLEAQEIARHEAYTKGFNYTKGGLGSTGLKHTEEASKKMSQTRKVTFLGEGNPFYGKSHSTATREKIAEATRSRMKGVPKPKEQKEKMSINSPLSKKVVIDGVTYRSCTEAENYLGISRRTVTNRVKSSKFPNYYFAESERNV